MTMKTEHALWLDAYYEVVAATQTPPYDPANQRLTESQIDAYRTLPDLIDQCEKAWLALPVQDRSMHFLLYV